MNQRSTMDILPVSPAAWFTLAVVVPSLGIIQKYAGAAGAVTYAILASVLCQVVWRHALKQPQKSSSTKLWWLLSLIVIGLAVAVIYPAVNTAQGGSDRDDALDIATRALLSGHYPYLERTYLGNLITPLPGSLLLSIPFVLLGHSAWQNVFWLAAFAVTMSRERATPLALWAVLILSPIASHEVLSGGDLLANSLYVMLIAVWLVEAAADPGATRLRVCSLAALFGISLSSRFFFLAVLPLLVVEVWRRAGRRQAMLIAGITMTVFALVTLPFYLYAPSDFTPLHTVSALSRTYDGWPRVEFVVVLVMAGVTLWAVRQSPSGRRWFLCGCALVLAVPVLCGIWVQSLGDGRLNLAFSEYGLSFLFFGLAGTWPGMLPGGSGGIRLGVPRAARPL